MPAGEVYSCTTFWADCALGEADDCHITIDGDYNSRIEDVDIEAWLSYHGWLYVGDNGAYCPVCRKLLHD